MVELSVDEMLAKLGVAPAQKPLRAYTPQQERIIAGFEDILKFHEEHGRAPQHGEQRDIFERLYAVRLDCLRRQEDALSLLADMDNPGLLDKDSGASGSVSDTLDVDALLAKFNIEGDSVNEDITQLRHVQTRDERRAAEEIANRERCVDFAKFQPLFADLQLELDSGVRSTRPFVKDAGFLKADIDVGQFFILGGQMAYVAEVGEAIKAPNGEMDARLRVIYSNGTESNLLRRSLQRALYKDDAGRRISEPSAGPLFGNKPEDEDSESGTIYVLRSKSDHRMIAQHRELIHKIGVTGGSVATRIAAAENDATYLLAGVEIVAEYKLFNINRTKLEKLIHRFFVDAAYEIEIADRFGKPVRPREWFLVPLHIIDEAVERVRDGTITEFRYDPATATILRATA